MTTTRSYTLPPDAVEAAGKALDHTSGTSREMSRAECEFFAETAITAFLDHMMAIGELGEAFSFVREDRIAYILVLPALEATKPKE